MFCSLCLDFLIDSSAFSLRTFSLSFCSSSVPFLFLDKFSLLSDFRLDLWWWWWDRLDLTRRLVDSSELDESDEDDESDEELDDDSESDELEDELDEDGVRRFLRLCSFSDLRDFRSRLDLCLSLVFFLCFECRSVLSFFLDDSWSSCDLCSLLSLWRSLSRSFSRVFSRSLFSRSSLSRSFSLSLSFRSLDLDRWRVCSRDTERRGRFDSSSFRI